MIVYHGSPQLVSVPLYGEGKAWNDYGLGFYCTQDLELAKEWACPEERDGFANQYRFDTEGLSCLNLGGKDYHILNWLAILLENRVFDITYPIIKQGRQYILEHFLPAYKDYDYIIGYRADDSYFSFAKAFLSNTISLEQLNCAMRLGKLGTQVVLRSPKSFDAICKEMTYIAPASVYYAKRMARDRKAREDYFDILAQSPPTEGVHLIDIMKENWTNDDKRLQSVIS